MVWWHIHHPFPQQERLVWRKDPQISPNNLLCGVHGYVSLKFQFRPLKLWALWSDVTQRPFHILGPNIRSKWLFLWRGEQSKLTLIFVLFGRRCPRVRRGCRLHPGSIRGQKQIHSKGDLLSHDLCYWYTKRPVCLWRCHGCDHSQ